MHPTFLSEISQFDLHSQHVWPYFAQFTLLSCTDQLLDPGWDLNQQAYMLTIFFQDFERFSWELLPGHNTKQGQNQSSAERGA